MFWLMGLSFLVFSFLVIIVILRFFSEVNKRLLQMQDTLNEANKIIFQNLGNTTNVFGNVKEQLTRQEEVIKQIYQTTKDISNFQELLRVPKFRGQMAEVLLENLLAQVLPKDNYQIQYQFKTNAAIVDAVIKLGERLVPIDAKFSLENFQKMFDAQDEETKNTYRKRFIQDVKNRVDEIATKYILPDENTYDFALMYIPAENVYYEVIIKEELFSYCIAKKVIPVSANTFYIYLQIICLGLKGLKIEENAKNILKALNALGIEINKFKDEFDILGKHILDAANKYSDSQKKLERISYKITNIQDTKKIE